ncbi:MAG TPA: hypothetical protein VHE35_28085, partial [Kofleriaceae bacterium]|nr:hypothetical protein [Kofleriaceae bacterium]
MREPAGAVIDRDGLGALLARLVEDGYEVSGPTVADDAIVIDALGGVGELPAGIGDEQAPGRYRLRRRDDGALFGYATPAQGWKRVLYPPRVELVRIRRRDGRLAATSSAPAPRRRAFVGVRACELAAIAIHDRVLRDGAYADADYRARRGEIAGGGRPRRHARQHRRAGVAADLDDEPVVRAARPDLGRRQIEA